jgi:hypothetical protein
MKIERYKTVTAKNFRELDQSVEMELKHGWQPFGSPYVRDGKVESYEGDCFFCQAMVMEKGMH